MSDFIRFLFNVTIYVIILNPSSHAVSLNGIEFAESISEANTSLVLNGVGARTYMFVDVYVAGLYLTEKKQNTDEILNLRTPKVIRMHYFRDISKIDLNKVWKYSFEEICKPNCGPFENAFNEFYNATVDVKKGMEISYVFTPQFIEIRNPDKTHKIVKDNFDNLLLSTWIGENPPTKKLKNGLLGK